MAIVIKNQSLPPFALIVKWELFIISELQVSSLLKYALNPNFFSKNQLLIFKKATFSEMCFILW